MDSQTLNFFCDSCEKNITSTEDLFFSNRDKNIDFCSKECKKQWESKANKRIDDVNLFFIEIENGYHYDFKSLSCEDHYKKLIRHNNYKVNYKKPEDYEQIIPKLYSWKNNQRNDLPSNQLPTRLYNLETEKVELVSEASSINNYAILSYVWGENEKGLEKIKYNDRKITLSSKIALQKAISALTLLNQEKNQELLKNNPDINLEELKKTNINHLWVDQLCMNQ